MLKSAARNNLEASPLAPTYTSSEVARIARVSLRQLQWWDERNLVSPQQHGHRRLYTPAEVLEVTLIAELRRKGFSLQKLRRVVKYLQKEMGRRLSELFASDSRLHLLTDGRSIYLEQDNERVIDILKNARQPMFLVSVSDQLQRLGAAMKKPVRSERPSLAARRARAS